MADDFTNLLAAHGGSDNDRKIAMNAVRDGASVPEPAASPATNKNQPRPPVPPKTVNSSDAVSHTTPAEYEGRSRPHTEDQFGDSVLDMDDLDLDADHVDMTPIVSDEPESGATYLDETYEPPPPPPSTGTVMDWMRGTGDPDRSGAASLYGDDDDDDFARPKKTKIVIPSVPTPSQVLAKHPTWKRPAIFAAAAAVIGIVVAFVFGGSPESETPNIATPPMMAEEDTEPAEAEVVELRPKAVSALCPPGNTSATLAFSKRTEDAWVCGRANGIDGAIMNIVFPSPVTVKSITVMPGWAHIAPNGRDNWNEHRLVTQILWRLGGHQFIQPIVPTRAGATLTIPGDGVTTSVMSLTIQKTERPSAVEGGSLEDVDGEIHAPAGVPGDDSDKVDESTAISSIVIMGIER
ncbi:MAG: hypothetical protein E6R04_04495 [Spirochaetes bacterium]|nr:MAG: hypothetical protein E6R04_04495 [Spirochaetota bacterium]